MAPRGEVAVRLLPEGIRPEREIGYVFSGEHAPEVGPFYLGEMPNETEQRCGRARDGTPRESLGRQSARLNGKGLSMEVQPPGQHGPTA